MVARPNGYPAGSRPTVVRCSRERASAPPTGTASACPHSFLLLGEAPASSTEATVTHSLPAAAPTEMSSCTCSSSTSSSAARSWHPPHRAAAAATEAAATERSTSGSDHHTPTALAAAATAAAAAATATWLLQAPGPWSATGAAPLLVTTSGFSSGMVGGGGALPLHIATALENGSPQGLKMLEEFLSPPPGRRLTEGIQLPLLRVAGPDPAGMDAELRAFLGGPRRMRMEGHHIFLAPFMEGAGSENGHHAAPSAAHHPHHEGSREWEGAGASEAEPSDYDPHLHHHHDAEGAMAVFGPIATGLVAFAGALIAIRIVREFLAPSNFDDRGLGPEGELQQPSGRAGFGSQPPTFQPFGGRSHRLSGEGEDSVKRNAGTVEER